ncbi:hypothetical protein DJ568_13610 [Mucilaginibacter hurinus]|uniref:Uncharacterized protein n=1 Tax=Mucilaginibacter hurinus TaxID=2201324 RepID=A0A367GNQ5_9SPHI|nr:hypothetical protein [Mucilaginibacter hurinus]RCH54323.1 hypothetical protein DJ568_13610 [Mucilaginibacter hurinus]
MKKLLYTPLLVVLLNSCDTAQKTQSQQDQQAQSGPCPDKVCTMMFASVPVKFVNSSGNPAAVKDYRAVNLRTNQDITHKDNDSVYGNYFAVADDSDLKKLSEAGDNIEVTAIDSASNKKLKAVIKVSGGECACHVARVAGPEEIMVN